MDTATFLRHLRRSDLVSDTQLRRAAERLNGEPVCRVAEALVADGLLTRYQARQLLAGITRGLRLGPYRILDRLGQGSSGIVYKAVHADMRRVVALKVFWPAESREGKRTAALFQREAWAAARLDHPLIVAVYDADRAAGVDFLAMEYVNGSSLTALVHRRGPLPVRLACELTRQAALTLEYAHGQGVVHRDIKPSNLLLAVTSNRGPNGDQVGGRPLLKILDFGLARLRPSSAVPSPDEPTIGVRPGATWGTLDFISPEQLGDVHAADARSDLYSLGCTLYYLLSGQVPFPGANVLEKLSRRAAGRVRPLVELRPEIPAAVQDVVERLMAEDPGQRYQSAAELMVEPALHGDTQRRTPRPVPPAAGASVPTGPSEPRACPDPQEQVAECPAAAGNGTPPAPTPAASPAPIIERNGSPLQPPLSSTGRLFWPIFGLVTLLLMLLFEILLRGL